MTKFLEDISFKPELTSSGFSFSYFSVLGYTKYVFDLIRSPLENFELELAQELRSSVAFIDAIGEDLVSAGGKRFRPSLAFLAEKLLAAKAQDAMIVALAVELLHSASLLHDDLIDDADTRRGKEAAFRRYGNVVSVMSGDYMLAKVLGLLARAGEADFTMLMSRTAADICEAEVLQFEMASLESYSFENYTRIITGKTAVLFAAALEGVAILSHSSPEQRQALKNFGLYYGRAFQMQDDYLDLLGDSQKLGKPVGGDLREGKATYAILKLILEAQNLEAQEILRRHATYEGDVARMIELVKSHSFDKDAKAQIIAQAQAAKAELAIFEPSEAKEKLLWLADQEIARSH